MKKLSERQWNDLSHRIANRPCSFCKEQSLDDEPHYGTIGDIDVLMISCYKCGHIELFNVSELAAVADKINEDFIRKGLRNP